MADRTKKALASSLKSFLNQKTMDKITVTDIANDCGINRQTFYYHFQDIYALGEWLFANEINKALGNDKGYDNWKQDLLKILLYVYDNKDMVLHTYHSLDREYLEGWLFSVFYNLFSYMIHEQSEGIHISEDDKDFIANFYKYALTGLILDWIKCGMKEDATEMVCKICKLIDGDIPKAIHKYRINEEIN